MPELLHITERSDWDAAQPAGSYRVSTRGVSLEQQGFIHCSLPHQLRGVAEACYAEADDLIVLVIDPAALTAEVRFEASAAGGDGERYPHIYGPLPVAAVTRVLPVSRDAAGRLILPEDW
jgi:uncharacterized protein (DUF952 family)